MIGITRIDHRDSNTVTADSDIPGCRQIGTGGDTIKRPLRAIGKARVIGAQHRFEDQIGCGVFDIRHGHETFGNCLCICHAHGLGKIQHLRAQAGSPLEAQLRGCHDFHFRNSLCTQARLPSCLGNG